MKGYQVKKGPNHTFLCMSGDVELESFMTRDDADKALVLFKRIDELEKPVEITRKFTARNLDGPPDSVA